MFACSLISFNLHGTPLPSSHTMERYHAICQRLEQSSADILTLQEVWSYQLLHTLRTQLPSYPSMAYAHGMLGPQAGLVTASRSSLQSVRYIDIPPVAEPRKKKWVNRLKRFAKKKGALLSVVADTSLTICNTYLVANGDGDWSECGRYYRAHEHDLRALVDLITQISCEPQASSLLVSGDFNIPKGSNLYTKFVHDAHVMDLFASDASPTYHKEFLAADQISHCIDYIFIRSLFSARIQQPVVLFKEKVTLPSGKCQFLSDHLGLFVHITVHERYT
jgi:endonuclease/exonuclease/phosphatase family metal-dependent hydrolase